MSYDGDTLYNHGLKRVKWGNVFLSEKGEVHRKHVGSKPGNLAQNRNF